MLYRQIQIVIQFRGGLYLKQSDFMAHGTSDRSPAVHRATPRHVEFVSRENSGRQRKGKPVFEAAASRVGDAPTGLAFEERFDLQLTVSKTMPRRLETRQRQHRQVSLHEDAATNSLPAHPSGLCYQRLQLECLIK